jgi:hypothetical protein
MPLNGAISDRNDRVKAAGFQYYEICLDLVWSSSSRTLRCERHVL